MENIAEPKRTPEEVNLLNPLVWAYVGDSVYELFIRTNLVNNSNEKVHKLHVNSIKFVKAAGQAKILKAIEEELTEEEVVAGFEFETGKEPEEEQYPEDVPMFKQKRLEDR